MFLIVLLALWWFFIRPAHLAQRQQQEKQLRERIQAHDLQQRRLALEDMETFHWQKTLPDMVINVDVHFPSMRMRREIASMYAGESGEHFDIRRKSDGTWEQRFTQEMQAGIIRFMDNMRKKVVHYTNLPENERRDEDNPNNVTQGLWLLDGNEFAEWSVAAIDDAMVWIRKNEWHPIRELGPQIEFHYHKLMNSYPAQGE
jgi:hypothetical protein